MQRCKWLDFDVESEIPFCKIDSRICFAENCEDYEAENGA